MYLTSQQQLYIQGSFVQTVRKFDDTLCDALFGTRPPNRATSCIPLAARCIRSKVSEAGHRFAPVSIKRWRTAISRHRALYRIDRLFLASAKASTKHPSFLPVLIWQLRLGSILKHGVAIAGGCRPWCCLFLTPA